MLNYYNYFINQVNEYLKKKKTLTSLLVVIFDYGSKITHFFLFNFFAFSFLMLLFFFVPIYFSEEFFNFLIFIIKEPRNLIFSFKKLPFALQTLLSFYVLFLEFVFFCTFLASIPLIKKKMIEKYSDPLILKKRGYNMLVSSARRATMIGLPLTAAVIVIADTQQHHKTIEAILEANARVWQEFARTGDKRLLDNLQKIPTNSVTTQIQNVTVKALNFLVEWKSGTRTKD